MQVEVPETDIASEVQTRLLNLSRNTRVQGFRPGKAPMKVIRQRFGSQVRQEVIGEVVQSSFFEAVTREKLRPAGNPQIHPLTAIEGAGLKYTARFEVLPEFELADVKKLRVEKAECTINDADIDRMVDTLRRQRRKLEPAERESRTGDVVEIDFSGTLDGEPFEGGNGREFRIEIGSANLIKGFEEGLAGHKPGEEFDLDLRFPEDYGNDALKGKAVRFHVHMNKVFDSILPPVDETLFREFGVKEGGEPAFRAEVRVHMEREAQSVIRNRLRDNIMDALHKANDIALPPGLVDREKHRLLHQFEEALKARGLQTGDPHNPPGGQAIFEEQAKKRIALQLIIGELIRKAELKADPAKVRRLIEKNAQSYEDPAAIISWYYADRSRLAEVEALALEDEVMDWIASRAQVDSISIPFDGLVNKMQTKAV